MVDGASSSKRSGAGIILYTPQGETVEQSLKFEFKASNNQAEYEAIIHGLRLVQDLQVKDLIVKSDSQLVVSQINGDYQAKDGVMIKYLEKVQKQIESFSTIQ